MRIPKRRRISYTSFIYAIILIVAAQSFWLTSFVTNNTTNVHTSLSSTTCHIWPGKYFDSKTFNFIYRMAYNLNNHSREQTSIMCIIPRDHTVQLQTYASECDTVVHDMMNGVNFHSMPFDWVYLSKPQRYLIVPHLRALRAPTDQPIVMPIVKAIVNRNKVKPVCPGDSILNRKAFLQLLDKYGTNLKEWHDELECPTQPVKDAGLFLEFDRKDPQDLIRIHEILYGKCDWTFEPEAIDAKGKAFVPDVTRLRQNPVKLNFKPKGMEDICKLPPGKGVEGRKGYKGIQKIKLATEHQDKKVLCMVYTFEERHEQVRSLAETWAPLCDGFFAASTKTDLSIGALNLTHEGDESYKNMWMKTRAILEFVHKHYLHDFDYFHLGGDDMFVIPENLRYFASTGGIAGNWDPDEPIFLGAPMKDDRGEDWRYNGGGPGYTLNRKALELLVTKLYPLPKCRPHFESSKEDLWIARCFREAGIFAANTNDRNDEVTYHLADFNFHASWKEGKKAFWKPPEMAKQNITQPEGLGQISEYSVAFHLKPISDKQKDEWPLDGNMRRTSALLRGLCP